MIWLSWRQHRLGMLVLGITLALMAAYLIHSGLVISAGYHQMVQGMSAASCVAQQNASSLCQTLRANFFDTYEDPNWDPLIFIALPALMGMILGAPLVARELEQGTFRLAWTQSVTRLRWLLIQVGWQLAITLIAFAIISQLVTWYLAQNGSFDGSWDNFDIVGIALLAYMVFALALGVALGAFVRSTVVAMFLTPIGYAVVRILIGVLVRPYYVPPYSTGPFDPDVTTPQTLPGRQDWVTSITWTDHAGNVVSDSQIGQVCQGPLDASHLIPSAQTILHFRCTHAYGWLQTITWQPPDRFWLFQGIESAIFFGLAAGLLALTYWWIRERIA